ncbi:mg2+ transporter [Fusarium flagelliforme]|uniref:Mg2+ transporter n=2 Tax=Fusarium flagelliforme TaxID=2675880 RepID=A0A395MAW0_9HYPO|nr:mg2+ transporter [Fusarium flagelliforme]
MEEPVSPVTIQVDRMSRPDITSRHPSRSRSPSMSHLTDVSSGSSSAGDASTNGSEYPKRGRTRIPSKLVSKRAIIDLGYPFFEEGNIVIIQKALGQDNVDELLKLSEDYKKVEEEIRAQRGGQQIPVGHEDDVSTQGNNGNSSKRPCTEQVLISGVLGLNTNGLQWNSELTSLNGQDPWTKPKTLLENSTVSAELFNIHAAEYYQDQTKTHKVTLLCPNRPHTPEEKADLVKMRWLLFFGIENSGVQDLVTHCPYLSTKLKSVALAVLREVDRQRSITSESKSQVESGTIVRYVGHTSKSLRLYEGEPTRDTQPVIFISTPSLAIPSRNPLTSLVHNRSAKTLLESLYGYEAGSVRQPPFGAPRLRDQGDKTARTLQVPETWFLLIGSDILISLSELSSQELGSGNITVDRRLSGSTPGIYTVRVVDNARMCKYHVVIERDCNYVRKNFIKHAAGLAQDHDKSADEYTLTDDQQRPVGPSAWLDLMTSGEVENRVFGLQTLATESSPQKKREFLALSAKLLKNGYVPRDINSSDHRMIHLPVVREAEGELILKDRGKTYEDSRLDASAGGIDDHTPLQVTNRRPISYTGWNRQRDMEVTEDTYRNSVQGDDGPEDGAGLFDYRFIPRPDRGDDADSLDGSLSEDTASDFEWEADPGDHESTSEAVPLNQLPPATGIVGANIVPFLTWRLSWDTNERTLEDSDRALIHLLNRIHGSLEDMDLILRHIYLSSVSPQRFTTTSRVTVSPLISSVRKGTDENSPSGQCKHCDEQLEYSSPYSALNHIHTDHLQCKHPLGGSRVLDDPCLGWVQWYGFGDSEDESVISTVVTLIEDLTDFHAKAHDIHVSVSGPFDEKQGPESRPHLLRNLVRCFEAIVGKMVLTAKELSWMNRTRLRNAITDGNPPLSIPLSRIRLQRIELDRTLLESFNLTKRDVMVLGTTHDDIDRLIISPIGSEFLLCTLLSNLQNNTILQDTGRSIDIIKHYRKVSTGLRFSAVRNPKRQRFLEISALEEQLDAIRAIQGVQGRLMDAYRTILDPDFFATASTDWAYLKDRKAMFPLERTQLDLQVRKLAEDGKTLEGLRHIAQSTRHDMKQIIEVLEEGHGKAIRVFTFVTLFFLPLSFVTSFFGMNTRDIRDTEWDQRLFWSSAVPVTALVLALALIYGYKWEEVTELFKKTFSNQDLPQLHDISEQDLMPLSAEASAESEKMPRLQPASTHRTPWIHGLAYVRKRQKSKINKSDVQRQETFDSLLV